MKRISILFLQTAIVLIGIGALALMLWEPRLEGRNAHATLVEIYFNDPFLAYMYTASLPFFAALHQAFALAGYAGQNKLVSPVSVKAARMIKRCAWAVAAFIVGGEAYLFIIQRDKDDIAGGVAVGLVLMCLFIVIAAVAAAFERFLRRAIDWTSANDRLV